MQSWLSGISWSDYFTGIGTIAGGYYAIVLAVYYRKDMVQLAAGKREALVAPKSKEPESKLIRPGMPETDLHRVHDLMEELKPVFADKEQLLGKPDLLARIQARLQKYVQLLGSEFEDAVIHHIILESNEQCGIALHAEEIKGVWKEGPD